MTTMADSTVLVIARALLAAVFVVYGLGGLVRGAWSGSASSIGLQAVNATLLAAGLLVLFGWQVRWMALGLAAFLLTDAFVPHPFWRHSGPEQHNQLLHFLKNVSMLGGFLLLAAR